jgi:hypothetical protein
MAQPIPNGSKELNLNKPDTFDGNREGFKKFLQDVKVYMDVNHEMYNNNLRKITFVLSFMMTGSAATWKAQFIDEAYNKPAPTNLNDRLGTYTTFRKELLETFLMFDSVGDALDELQSLRKKKTHLIDEHIAKFKMLAMESKIKTMNFLSIKLFKEMLPWALIVQLMKLETPLKTVDDWYKWAARLCQDFTKSHSSSGLNRLWPQGLKEYSDSYLISDYLRPILGSKCLVMQTTGNYLGLFRTRTSRGDLREDVSGCHPDFQSFILYSLYVYLMVSLL